MYRGVCLDREDAEKLQKSSVERGSQAIKKADICCSLNRPPYEANSLSRLIVDHLPILRVNDEEGNISFYCKKILIKISRQNSGLTILI